MLITNEKHNFKIKEEDEEQEEKNKRLNVT